MSAHWGESVTPHYSPTAQATRVARSTRRGAVAACLVAVALLILSGVIVWAELREVAAWDPLGRYPVQQVLNPGNEIRLGELVVVDAVKCADELVEVRGVLSWQAINPPGAIIEVGTSVGERPVGCTETIFRNVIPPEVEEVIREQHANGIDAPVWRVTGTEVPFDGDREGVSRVWVTENFTVLP